MSNSTNGVTNVSPASNQKEEEYDDVGEVAENVGKKNNSSNHERGIEMSERIKAHHAQLRASAEATHDPVAAWEKMKKDNCAALKQYANDMQGLATEFWQHGNVGVSQQVADEIKQVHQQQQQQQTSATAAGAAAISFKKPGASAGEKNMHTDRLLYIMDVIRQYFCMEQDFVKNSGASASRHQHQQSSSATASLSTNTAGDGHAPIRREREHADGQLQHSSFRAAVSVKTNEQHNPHEPPKYATIPGWRLPGLVAGHLKEFRRKSWDVCGRAATDSESDKFALDCATSVLQRMFSTSPHFPDSSSSPADLRIVDIGSCYNPLRNLVLPGAGFPGFNFFPLEDTRSGSGSGDGTLSLRIDEDDGSSKNQQRWMSFNPVVVGLDLCPQEGSGVFQCDVFAVKPTRNDEINDGDDAASEKTSMTFEQIRSLMMPQQHQQSPSQSMIAMREREIRTALQLFQVSAPALVEAAPTSPSITGFKLPGSCHVVTFCLLLSYLPSPTMRLQCCFNAWRMLMDDGLFIVVSTRTQNSKNSKWENQWVAAIEQLGFERFRKDVRVKLVGLAFRKKSHAEGGGGGDEGGSAKRIERFEELPEKLRLAGLPIGADNAL